MSDFRMVRLDRSGAVATITLARAERHNALVPALVDDLRAALTAVEEDTSLRAVVLAAEGRSFSTGGDVAEFAARSGRDRAAYARETVGGLHDAMLDMLRLRVPIVCAVHGQVTGGSLGLVLASDLVLVGPGATFTPYYVDVGFSPDGGWTALLPRRIGRARALRVQLLNQTVDARTAVAWGLADELVGEPRDVARARAAAVAGKLPGATTRTRRLLADVERTARLLGAERDSFVEQVVTDEATDGMAAFLDRTGSTHR